MANNLVAFDATQFSTKMVEKLDRINVMLGLVNRDYDGDLTQNSTVKIRTLGNVTMGTYSGSISYGDMAPSVEDFTVSTKDYFALKVGDIEQRQSDKDVLGEYANRAATAMNDKIEDLILARYVDVPVANRVTGASAAAITLTASNVYAQFVAARTLLSKANVPSTDRFAVVDSDTYALMLQAPEFIRSTADSDALVANGRVGSIAGFEVYESQAVPVASGSKYILCGQKFAISYAGQLLEVETVRLESSFDTALRGLLLHGAFAPAEAAKRLAYIKATA